jgi:tripartite-type tricarboxylate transporter receptor subunit TctC
VKRRRILLASAGAMLPARLGAQPRAWPGARPIEVIVPFPPGGGMDVMARSFLPYLQPHLPGATFVVINRAGAGGQIGTEAVANAAPDGHTIGAAAFPALVSTPIERPVRWRPAELTYLANVVDDPCGLFVPPASPLRGLADLLARAKARPGDVTYGTAGTGGDDHITTLLLEEAAAVRLSHVPFSGTAQLLPPLLAGQLDIGAFNLSEALPLLRDGSGPWVSPPRSARPWRRGCRPTASRAPTCSAAPAAASSRRPAFPRPSGIRCWPPSRRLWPSPPGRRPPSGSRCRCGRWSATTSAAWSSAPTWA